MYEFSLCLTKICRHNTLIGGFSVCSITSSFFIGVILRFMFVADGNVPPATAYCFLKVGNAPLSS